MPAEATLSGGIGVFSATLVTSGSQTITATDATTGTLTGHRAPIVVSNVKFEFTNPSLVTAGSAFNYTVVAENQATSQVLTSYLGTVTFTSSDPIGVLPAPYTFTSSDQGQHVFSSILKTATNSAEITATDVANGIIGSSSNIIVSAANATHYAITGPSTSSAGTAYVVTVTAEDAFNNVAVNYGGIVSFSSSDKGASTVLPASSHLVQGVGTFSATLTTAGNQTLTATDTVNSSISASIATVSVTPAAASHFVITSPMATTAGNAFLIVVTAEDKFNNIATSYTGSVKFSSTDAQSVPGSGLPIPSTLFNLTNAPGFGYFAVELKTAGPQVVTVTDTSVASLSGVSVSINVSPTAASHFILSPSLTTIGAGLPGAGSSFVTANQGFQVTVTVADPFNNVATGYTGTAVFSTSDTGAGVHLPAGSALTSGKGVFSATLVTEGNQSLTATDSVNNSGPNAITGSFNPLSVQGLVVTKITHRYGLHARLQRAVQSQHAGVVRIDSAAASAGTNAAGGRH